jgi:hypothetical protein
MRLSVLAILVARLNEWVSMNGFRTFLATLQFPDDRLVRPRADAAEAEAIEANVAESACNAEHTDEQRIAA